MRASKITAVDFFDDLTSPYARKRFFWGFIALCLLCVGGIFFNHLLLPEGVAQNVVDAVATQILGGSLIILAFYGLYLHFIGPNPGLREVTVIRPNDIRERIEQLPVNARHYSFWGRSGSYFRSHPLRVLDDQARKQKLITDVEVLLPDPNDGRLIKAYQEILTALGEKPSGNPLLSNVLATSIACAVVSANNKYIRIKLIYSNFLPAFRIDVSDNGAILTQDDPSKSALFFESGSEFYEMLRTTIRNEMNVSREVNWDATLFNGRNLDETSCDKHTLSAFGIEVTNVDELQQQVGQLIKERRHRYQ